jgi:hypothetical protein
VWGSFVSAHVCVHVAYVYVSSCLNALTDMPPHFCPPHMLPSQESLCLPAHRPQLPPCMVPGLLPCPQSGSSQGRGGYLLSCAGTREGAREETGEETKSYSTWINLSARAALSYPAGEGGSEQQGKEAEQNAQGQERGETDKNHLSLMQWTISRSRGERSEDQRTSRRGPGGRPKPEPAPSWRGVCVS